VPTHIPGDRVLLLSRRPECGLARSGSQHAKRAYVPGSGGASSRPTANSINSHMLLGRQDGGRSTRARDSATIHIATHCTVWTGQHSEVSMRNLRQATSHKIHPGRNAREASEELLYSNHKRRPQPSGPCPRGGERRQMVPVVTRLNYSALSR